jgi:hypothetical protein
MWLDVLIFLWGLAFVVWLPFEIYGYWARTDPDRQREDC